MIKQLTLQIGSDRLASNLGRAGSGRVCTPERWLSTGWGVFSTASFLRWVGQETAGAVIVEWLNEPCPLTGAGANTTVEGEGVTTSRITTTPSGDVYYVSLAGNHVARIGVESGQATVIEPPTANMSGPRHR